MAEFFRETSPYTKAIKIPDDSPRTPGVRLFCTQRGAMWTLQVRANVELAGGRRGKDFVAAQAPMTRDDLRALRAAIDAQLEEDLNPGDSD